MLIMKLTRSDGTLMKRELRKVFQCLARVARMLFQLQLPGPIQFLDALSFATELMVVAVGCLVLNHQVTKVSATALLATLLK